MAAMIAIFAHADTETIDGIEWTYTVSNGEVSLGGGHPNNTAIPQTMSGVVNIPSSLGGYPVTSIGEFAFFRCKDITSVTIPDSVTSIDYWALAGCSFTEVCIPKSVTNIAYGAFSEDANIVSFIVDESNPAYKSQDGLLLSKDGTTLVHGVNGDVIVPDTVTTIAEEAFYVRIGLTSIEIPKSVTNIGTSAFCYCSGLEEVTIPDSVTEIGILAFANCESLTSVTIPDSVTSIGWGAFDSCSGLTNVTIPDSVTSIGSSAFSRCSGLTSVAIPDSVTSIGYLAFSSCSGLTSVTIPNSVTSIGQSAFSSCNNLTSVTIPNSVTNIGKSAFYRCSGFTGITIPDSVTSIGDGAFYSCSGLTSVTIPDSVTSIGSDAFSRCSGLTSVTMKGDAPSVGDWAFDYIGEGAVVHLPRGLSGYDVDADGKWQGMTVEWYGPEFTIDANGVLTKVNLHGATEVVIPNSVTSIGGGAFSRCSGLTSITIPNSVTSIGDCAFSGCSGLTSITIPDSVTSIGPYAFEGCSGLADADGFIIVREVLYDYIGNAQRIRIPDSVKIIRSYAFDYKESLISVMIAGSVMRVEDRAFHQCENLKEITIGRSVSSVGHFADMGTCLNKLIMLGDEPNVYSDSIIDDYSPSGCVVYLPKWNNTYTIKNGKWYGITVSRESPFDLVANDGHTWSYWPTSTSETEATISGVSPAIGKIDIPAIITDGESEYLVTSIGDHAFYGCSGLTSVTIPDSVTSIGDSAFSGCSGLTSVTIPDSVTSIGRSVFSSCNNLTNVTIPDSVEAIAPTAFDGCGKLWAKWFRTLERLSADEAAAANEVALTVTNVVVHYVTTAAVSEAVTPSEDIGIVNVISEVSAGTAVAISSEWAAQYPGFAAKFGSDFTAAITKPTGKRDGASNAMMVWQDFVAGTDPTDENDKFTASITFDEDGRPIIAYSPELTPAEAAKRKYTTYGKVKLTDKEWTPIAEGEEENYNFFKVTVEMR